MKSIKRKVTLLLVVTAMLVGVMSVSASAKTIKLKNCGFTTSTAAAAAKATPVTMGSHTINLTKKGQGYLQFTAPATYNYTFKVSSVKARGSYGCGYFYVMTMYGTNNSSITMENAATQGGVTRGLFVASRTSKYSSKLQSFLKSRYGKVTLQAGQTAFLYFNMSGNKQFKLQIQ